MAETAPENSLRHVARGVPAKVELASDSSHGSCELCRCSVCSRQEVGPRTEGRSAQVQVLVRSGAERLKATPNRRRNWLLPVGCRRRNCRATAMEATGPKTPIIPFNRWCSFQCRHWCSSGCRLTTSVPNVQISGSAGLGARQSANRMNLAWENFDRSHEPASGFQGPPGLYRNRQLELRQVRGTGHCIGKISTSTTSQHVLWSTMLRLITALRSLMEAIAGDNRFQVHGLPGEPRSLQAAPYPCSDRVPGDFVVFLDADDILFDNFSQ